jgi:hypothetical protein
VGDQFGCFVSGADNNAYRMLLRFFFDGRGKKSQFPEEPTVKEQLNQGDETKTSKQYFSPMGTQIQSSHMLSTVGAGYSYRVVFRACPFTKIHISADFVQVSFKISC